MAWLKIFKSFQQSIATDSYLYNVKEYNTQPVYSMVFPHSLLYSGRWRTNVWAPIAPWYSVSLRQMFSPVLTTEMRRMDNTSRDPLHSMQSYDCRVIYLSYLIHLLTFMLQELAVNLIEGLAVFMYQPVIPGHHLFVAFVQFLEEGELRMGPSLTVPICLQLTVWQYHG